MLQTRGVLTDKQRLEMLDSADDRQLAAAEARLAHTRNAFVGVDGDEQVVARGVEDREGLDGSDLHRSRDTG